MFKSASRATDKRALTKFGCRSAYWNLSKWAFLQYWPTVLTHIMWRSTQISASISSVPSWNQHRKMYGWEVVKKDGADFISQRFPETDRPEWNCPEMSRRAEIRQICLRQLKNKRSTWCHLLFYLCVWCDVLCCRLQPATRIPLQPNHTETPTHI